MSYTKTTWRNNSTPALNATNLNKMEQGIWYGGNGVIEVSDEVADELVAVLGEDIIYTGA